MSTLLSRRTFVGASLALAGSVALPRFALAQQSTPRTLVAERRVIDVLGKPANVFGIRDQDGRQGLFLPAGERFLVDLENQIGTETIIHWHGQVPDPAQDGVSDTGYVSPLAADETRSFDFPARSGTHWMHSHHGLQEQSLLAAPLVVYTAEDENADMQDETVLLHDFSFRAPDEILSELTGGQSGGHDMHNMSGSAMPMDGGMMMGGMDHGMMSMDLNDVAYDAFLANDRTLEDPQIIRTEPDGRVRLRLINGATASAFWINLGDTEATVLAVDGNDVEPITGNRFPMTPAQRLDLLIDMKGKSVVPVLAQVEGLADRTGVIIAVNGAEIPKISRMAEQVEAPVDLSLEEKLVSRHPLVSRAADRTIQTMIMGSMAPYAWNLDNAPWPNRRPLTVAEGERVTLEIMNHSMMAHPMHLHGHHFQVTSLNGRALNGAVRDTVLVPPMATVGISFDADNPGRWLFHCHNLYHMATGMMTEVVYG
ncbi:MULTISPECIES: multicopper oxidase family protein [Devosia]|uniref:multicopper oxidase family protein n=1 Tax=Devosia TaxID=46913 RepID=UPI000CE9A278|nr:MULTISPECIES: multicopper oxidase family protein [Devosia]AVF04309.1 copper oxidase [Devosia sp. I507]